MQLLERFYDPTAGQILLDGRDIRTLDLQWYRGNVGLVSQVSNKLFMPSQVICHCKKGFAKVGEAYVSFMMWHLVLEKTSDDLLICLTHRASCSLPIGLKHWHLQEPTLFATDIWSNIAYGRPGATQADVEHAASVANAHSFISALPLGYRTQVGEKGQSDLSVISIDCGLQLYIVL